MRGNDQMDIILTGKLDGGLMLAEMRSRTPGFRELPNICRHE